MSRAALRLASVPIVVFLAVTIVSPASATIVVLQSGSADFSQNATTNTPDSSHDGSTLTGWAIGGAQGSNHTAAWESSTDLGGPLGTDFTFTMQMFGGASNTLRKFRLSITTDPRANYADGVINGGNVTANWVTLTPLTATDTGGATFTINGDNSVFVSGTNPSTNTYTLTATTTLNGITGFRLEAFAVTNPSDNAGPGPGRSAGGNFVLSEFQIDAVALPEPAGFAIVGIGALALVRRRRAI